MQAGAVNLVGTLGVAPRGSEDIRFTGGSCSLQDYAPVEVVGAAPTTLRVSAACSTVELHFSKHESREVRRDNLSK